MSLQSKHLTYFSLFNIIPTGIGIVDKEGYFVFANTHLCELFGYTVNEFVSGLSLTDLFKIKYPPELTDLISTPFYHHYDLFSKTEELHPYKIAVYSFSTHNLPYGLSSYEFLNIIVFYDISKIFFSEISRQKEWIDYAISKISIILYSHGKFGPEPILRLNPETLIDPEKNLLKFGIYLMAAIGQGVEHKTGLFGPLPVPDQDYLSIAYAFELIDSEQVDIRSKGKRYVVLAVLYPRLLDSFFQDRRQLRATIKKQLAQIFTLNDISLETLQNIHKALLQVNGPDEYGVLTQKGHSLESKLAAIYNLGKELIHATDLKSSFEIIASLCERSLDFKLFVVFYLDPASQCLRILSHRGYSQELNLDIISLPLTAKSVVVNVVQTGRTLNIPDINTIDYYMKIDSSVLSELAVPIKVDNEVLGVLNVESEQRNAFSDDDISLLTIVAERAGLILKQYQLQLRIQAVYSLAEELSHATNITQAFDKIAMFAEQNLRFEIFSALIPDEKDELLKFLCYRGYNWKSELDVPIIPINSNEYFVSYVFRIGKPLYVENFHRYPEIPHYSVRPGICAEYAIPLIIYHNSRKNEVIGVLNIEGTRPFTSADKYIFEMLAFEATMVLRLFRYHDQLSKLLGRKA